MRTTIKAMGGAQVDVAPGKFEAARVVFLTVTTEVQIVAMTITPDQAGALIFGIERALEVLDVQREAVTA